MADNVTVDNGDLTDYPVSSDEGAGGQVQRVKLAYSADGSETHVSADADGLLVNLGANNDITVTGTVAVTDNASTLSVDDGGSTISVDDGGASLTVDGTVAVSGTVTVDLGVNNDVTVTSGAVTADTELPTAAALADNAANPTTPTVGAAGLLYDGSTWDRAPGTAADGALVNLGSNNDVTVTGTVTVDGSGVTQPVSGTVTIQDGGNTITVDGSVTADTELPTAAALADNAANPTAPMVGANLMLFDGSTWDRARTGVGDAASSLGLVQNLGMLWNGSTHDRMPGSAADGALVNLGANNDVTVTGTVTANLAAGTNNIGDVDIASIAAGDNNIGNVDVVTLPSIPAGTNNIGDVDVLTLPGSLTGKAEDAAASSADVGVPVLVVRRDAASSGVDTDGDYAMLNVDSSGALRVTGGGGGTQYQVDDVAGATDTGSLTLFVRDDALAALTPADGDYTQGRTDSTGALWIRAAAGTASIGTLGANSGVDIGDVTINNASGAAAVNIQDGGNTITVDGTVGVSGTVTVDGSGVTQPVSGTVTANLAAGTNNIGDVDVLTLPGVAGVAAHDAGISGNPVVVGGVSSAAAPTDVTADQEAVRSWHLRNGAQATVITAAGALIGGDATNGLDVDVTRLPALAAGTNNIGDVDVLTLPSIPAGTNNIGDVDVLTLPALAAGTNTIGLVRNKEATGTIDDAGTDRTVKYVIIDAASSGDNTLLAAVASRKIRVLSAFIVSAGSVNVRFESGAAGTALTGQMNLVANTGFVLPYNPHGWFETAVNTLLNLELSGAISVDGSLTYVEVA
jgi:hypothetical protein